ncbi:MAG: phosphatase [Oscillospiraceae bacterium]|nr:phosphatase [Oscillospiraceae bacterium]
MDKQSVSAEELRRKYLKEWRKQHPEKVREYNRRYWERKAQKATSSEKAQTKSESEGK